MDPGRCYDLSLPLDANVLRYPGDPAPRIETVASCQDGDPLTISQLTLNCHVGTHIDAPAHFLAAGARVDGLAGHHFYGPAVVVSVDGKGAISPAELAHVARYPRRHILLKTANSALLSRSTFEPAYRTLALDAAEQLAALQPFSLGFDYYSLDPPSTTDFPAHLVLARAGIPVFLPLCLGGVEPGEYLFVGMPLPLVGVEASPVRAVLFSQ